MPQKRDDERAAAMWAMYNTGVTVAAVAVAFGCTPQSVSGVFKSRGWETRKRVRLPCTVEGCERLTFSRGLCQAHYQRVRRTGNTGSADVLVFSGATECRYEGCERPHSSRGLCLKHQAEERRDRENPGRDRRNRSDSGLARLIPNIDASGPCWEWQRHCNRLGYGRLRFQGRYWFAHRLMWTLLVGPIPPDLELDHLCFNPCCCNPDHLEPVTHAENLRRRRITGGKTLVWRESSSMASASP